MGEREEDSRWIEAALSVLARDHGVKPEDLGRFREGRARVTRSPIRASYVEILGEVDDAETARLQFERLVGQTVVCVFLETDEHVFGATFTRDGECVRSTLD